MDLAKVPTFVLWKLYNEFATPSAMSRALELCKMQVFVALADQNASKAESTAALHLLPFYQGT